MVFNMGWGCVVCGLVCSTSSVFSSGCCSRWGFLASGFHCVCVCVFVCMRAWLGAFGISTTHTQWKPDPKYPHREQQPEENPEDVEHTYPQTTHPQPILKTIDNTTYYHVPQTTSPPPTPPIKLISYQSLTTRHPTVTRNEDEISASPRNVDIYMILFEQNCNNLKMTTIGRNM